MKHTRTNMMINVNIAHLKASLTMFAVYYTPINQHVITNLLYSWLSVGRKALANVAQAKKRSSHMQNQQRE